MTSLGFLVLALCIAFGYAQNGCGGKLTGVNGTLTSPNWPREYEPDASCTWTIDVAKDLLIKLEFLDFELEEGAGDTCFDYVRIYDGKNIVGTYCGTNNPGIIYSSGADMRVQFVTDESIEERGFAAVFQALKKEEVPTTPAPTTTAFPPGTNCGKRVTADYGSVTSPNYPEDYPSYADCSYVMKLATGGRIALEFKDFLLEHDDACQNDYVVIHDGENGNYPQIAKFCGAGSSRVVGSGDSLYMRFVTDESDEFRGFNATFQKATCSNLGGTCIASNETCEHGELDWKCENGGKCCHDRLKPDECGKRPNERPAVHIVGGQEAVPNSWPWQISLQSNGRHYCGAVLYDNQWAVTAAHCVHDEQVVDLVLGEHDRLVPSGNELTIRASKIILHEEFINSSPWPNDIALLKFDRKITFNQYYSPVCMPEDLDEPFLGNETCYITGWGDTKDTGDRTVLNELLIKPQTNEACRGMWGEDSIKDTNICVGDGSKGSCQGDSGGPFVCKKNDKYVLGGVTSWGIRGCRTRGYPSVYTRISKFLKWMRDNMV